MNALKTFAVLVSLVMAALSLFPFLVILVFVFPDIVKPIAQVIFENTPAVIQDVVMWHHFIYWNAAMALGLAENTSGRSNPSLFFAIHGTNVLLGMLSLKAILRTAPTGARTVAIGPAINYVAPYVQQAALWLLNAITAGVLGNFVYDLIKGGP